MSDTTKICTQCKKELPLSCFGKEKRGKFGVRSVCRECRSTATPEFKKAKQEKDELMQAGLKRCNCCHEIKSLEGFSFHISKISGKKCYSFACKKCAAARALRYKTENPDKVRESRKKTYAKHRDKMLLRSAKYHRTAKARAKQRDWERRNREKVNFKSKLYRLSHKEKRREIAVAYRQRLNKRQKERKLDDPNYRIKCSLRNRFWQSLKLQHGIKQCSFDEYIGCALSELRDHIESLWRDGMSWDNYGKGDGKWNIDHIIPCDDFDLTQRDEQLRCYHYSNLQPMWAIENARKGNKTIAA